MNPPLSGQVALVTGASRGLGKAIAVSLAAHGAKVAVNYFGSEKLAHRTVEEITKAGRSAAAFHADVRDESQVKRMISEI